MHHLHSLRPWYNSFYCQHGWCYLLAGFSVYIDGIITMKERRKHADRRGSNFKKDCQFRCNRRFRADRRLNSIKAEWIPISHVNLHPATRLIFSKCWFSQSKTHPSIPSSSVRRNSSFKSLVNIQLNYIYIHIDPSPKGEEFTAPYREHKDEW